MTKKTSKALMKNLKLSKELPKLNRKLKLNLTFYSTENQKKKRYKG